MLLLLGELGLQLYFANILYLKRKGAAVYFKVYFSTFCSLSNPNLLYQGFQTLTLINLPYW